MGEIKVDGIFWSTYWSADGEHETGENFRTAQERAAKAVEMLERGWTVAYGDFAGLQEKLIRSAIEYDQNPPKWAKTPAWLEPQQDQDRVDEILGLLGPGPRKADRPADLNDPLWPAYWAWFERSDPEACRAARMSSSGGALGLARQEDFNCWKDHRQGILDAWNAWKHSHRPFSYGQMKMAEMRGNFIETLPDRDREFVQELPGLLDV